MNEKSIDKDFESVNIVIESTDKKFESINRNKKLTKEDFKNINTLGKIAAFWLALEIVLLALGG